MIAISENQFYLEELYAAEIAFYQKDRGEIDRIEAFVLGEMLEAKKVP